MPHSRATVFRFRRRFQIVGGDLDQNRSGDYLAAK
jgi:hypothetical protein